MVGANTNIGPNSDFTIEGELAVNQSADTLMGAVPSAEEITAWERQAAELGSLAYVSTRSRIRRAYLAMLTGGKNMESPVNTSPEHQILVEQGI